MKIPAGFIIFPLALLLVSFIIPPAGEFPLNDDWIFAWPVKHFLETGELRLLDDCAPSIIFQVIWGRLACTAAGGFSFTALRYSVLLLSLAGLLFFYMLLRKYTGSEKLPLLGTFLLMLNPLWLVLSYTFMTDVPYMALAIASVYFYYSGMRSGNNLHFLAGSAFSALAYLNRQLGIAIPFSALLYLLMAKKLDMKKATVISAIPVLAAAGHTAWFRYAHGLTWIYENGIATGLSFRGILTRPLGSLIYLGLFLLPLSACLAAPLRKPAGKTRFIHGMLTACTAASLAIFVVLSGLFPYFENTIHNYGLGTVTVADVSAKASSFLGSQWFRIILTLSGFLSVLRIIHLAAGHAPGTYEKHTPFLLMAFLGQFAVSVMRAKFFDRYLLVMVPAGIILLLPLIDRYKKSILPAAPLTALLCLYTLAGIHDYMNWNRAKWEAGGSAAEHGLKPGEVANGFDWDAWHTYPQNMEKLKSLKPAGAIREWEWQSLNRYRAIVSFSPRLNGKGYRLSGRAYYKTPLSRKPRGIYLWLLPAN